MADVGQRSQYRHLVYIIVIICLRSLCKAPPFSVVHYGVRGSGRDSCCEVSLIDCDRYFREISAPTRGRRDVNRVNICCDDGKFPGPWPLWDTQNGVHLGTRRRLSESLDKYVWGFFWKLKGAYPANKHQWVYVLLSPDVVVSSCQELLYSYHTIQHI